MRHTLAHLYKYQIVFFSFLEARLYWFLPTFCLHSSSPHWSLSSFGFCDMILPWFSSCFSLLSLDPFMAAFTTCSYILNPVLFSLSLSWTISSDFMLLSPTAIPLSQVFFLRLSPAYSKTYLIDHMDTAQTTQPKQAPNSTHHLTCL